MDSDTQINTRGLSYILFRMIQAAMDIACLVQDLIFPTGLCIVFGESNVGKTFFVLDLVLHIALGWSWMGRRVIQGGVVYVAAEAGMMTTLRVAAFRQHHKLQDKDVPFALVPCSIDLLNEDADLHPLIAMIRKAGSEMPQQVRVVVIDTLASAIAGGDENNPKDMGSLVRNLQKIVASLNVLVIAIHHPGKDASKGERGHSLLRCAADTIIQLTKKGEVRTASITKQRDLSTDQRIVFKLKTIELGENSFGEKVSSCVIEAAPPATSESRLKPQQYSSKALELLRELFRTNSTGTPVKSLSLEAWRKAFNDKYFPENARSIQKSRSKTFNRAITNLSELGLIKIDVDDVFLLD